MQNLLRADGSVFEDGWILLPRDASEADLPEGELLVPLALWLGARDRLLERASRTGVWLASDEAPETLAADLPRLALVAVDFPVFSDGRGYSTARILRERLGFRAELRAVGDVLRDQIFLMRRCGFDSFALRADRPASVAVSALGDFSNAYQQAGVDPGPALIRRGAR